MTTERTKVTEIEAKLEMAERAKKLGCKLCHRCYPPNIMKHLGGRHWQCRKCGHVLEVGKPIDTIRPYRRRRRS